MAVNLQSNGSSSSVNDSLLLTGQDSADHLLRENFLTGTGRHSSLTDNKRVTAKPSLHHHHVEIETGKGDDRSVDVSKMPIPASQARTQEADVVAKQGSKGVDVLCRVPSKPSRLTLTSLHRVMFP